jgi:ubiquinone/menaquinone biosynthesis C-methylase UbiE
MVLKREYTSKAGWFLDNVLPPVVRDSRVFMWPLFRLLFGRRMDEFMSFKERAWRMTEEEYVGTYDLLEGQHIQRETSLTEASVRRIVDAVVGPRVLDIACGRGYLARRIAQEAGATVVGVDIAPPAAQAEEAVTFLNGTVERIDFPDRSFDTVVSTHTLEHVRNLQGAVAELRRVARTRLIVVVPRQREYRYTFDLHLNFFPYDYCLKQVMKNEGASVYSEGSDFVYVEEVGDLRPRGFG